MSAIVVHGAPFSFVKIEAGKLRRMKNVFMDMK